MWEGRDVWVSSKFNRGVFVLCPSSSASATIPAEDRLLRSVEGLGRRVVHCGNGRDACVSSASNGGISLLCPSSLISAIIPAKAQVLGANVTYEISIRSP